MLILTSRNHEATQNEDLLETSVLMFPVFMAISKRNGFKAISMRSGVLVFSLDWGGRDWHAKRLPQKFPE